MRFYITAYPLCLSAWVRSSNDKPRSTPRWSRNSAKYRRREKVRASAAGVPFLGRAMGWDCSSQCVRACVRVCVCVNSWLVWCAATSSAVASTREALQRNDRQLRKLRSTVIEAPDDVNLAPYVSREPPTPAWSTYLLSVAFAAFP
jgi:hypothetical protein